MICTVLAIYQAIDKNEIKMDLKYYNNNNNNNKDNNNNNNNNNNEVI